MYNKKISIIMFILVVLTIFSYSTVYGTTLNNTTVVFDDTLTQRQASYTQLRSISRDSNGNDIYETVISKYNQPRSVGTTPHQGCDFKMKWTTENDVIYPPAAGTVRRTSTHSLSVEIGTGLYASYYHVVEYVNVGTAVTVNTQIGRIGLQSENGNYPEHCHFGFTTSSDMTVWQPLSPRLGAYSGWRYGHDLDFITFLTNPVIDTNNELKVVAYTCNDGNSGIYLQECEEVKLWYKIGSSSWQSINLTRPLYPQGYIIENKRMGWTIDLNSIGSVGQSVMWYISADRDVDNADFDSYDESAEPHNWALFPAKYKHPDENGNNYSPVYNTYTIR